MATKETFLRHVTTRLGRIPETEKTRKLKDLSHIQEQFPVQYANFGETTDALIEKFTTELETLSGIVKFTHSPEDTFNTVKEVLQLLDLQSVIYWEDDSLKRYSFDRLMQEGFHVMKPDSATEYKFFAKEAQAGITAVTFAVAETGSIVVETGDDRQRGTSLLPKLHIAIVRSNQFVARTAEVFKYLVKKTDSLPSSVNFITGPSRSADIEMDLSIGVHGPANICVIIEKV